MPINFLHGIESINVSDGRRAVQVVKSGVIGLIGTAPTWGAKTPCGINNITLVNSRREAALKIGPSVRGYTIPEALDGIFDQVETEVLVINLFNPAVHRADVLDEKCTFNKRGEAQLVHPGVLDEPVVMSEDGSKTYVAGTDYTWTPMGVIKCVPKAGIAPQSTVKVNYVRGAPEQVLAEDIIGDFDANMGVYTGMQQFLTAYSKLGFFPKILIAPGYSELRSVASALDSLAHNVRAITYIDAPVGKTVQEVIELRGNDQNSAFQTSSNRVELLYPRLKVYANATEPERLEAYSARKAGVRAMVDKTEGWWVSDSNHEIKGILGTERFLTARLNGVETDVNRLNEAGITTVFNSFGTGYRTFGNRSAMWPSDTHPRNFIAIQRGEDMVKESLEYAFLPFLDKPITAALIDAMLQTGNGFIRTLIARGALIDGSVSFEKASNPITEIALGHLTFKVTLMGPTPNERTTFEYFMDIELLKKLYSTNGDEA